MENNKIEQMLAQVLENQAKFETRFNGLETDFQHLKELAKTTNQVAVKLELEHGKKLDIICEGLDLIEDDHKRIASLEQRVEQHDDVIWELEQKVLKSS